MSVQLSSRRVERRTIGVLTLVPNSAAPSERIERPNLGVRCYRAFAAADPRTTRLAAWLGVVLVLRMCLPLAGTLNVWLDEAFTLHTTAAGPLAGWSRAVGFEMQPPLYFVLEAVWRSWNETSLTFARLPSIAFAAATVAVSVFAARRLAPRVPPLLVAVATAANPIVVWAATEMRVYALVLLIGTGLTWAFAESFLSAQPARSARAWYVALAVAGLYTQYFVGFLLAAQFVTLLVLRRRTVGACAACLAIVAFAFAPFVPVALVHVGASGDSVTHVDAGRAAIEVASSVFAYVLPHDLGWHGIEKSAGYAVAVFLAVGLVALGRPRIEGALARGTCVAWCVAVGIFSGVFALTGVPLDSLRHLIVLAPLSQLAALALLSSLTRRFVAVGCAALLIYAIFSITQLSSQYAPPAVKNGDWQRVATVLSADATNVPIAVFPAELALPLGVYSAAPVVSVPRAMPFTIDYVAATKLTSTGDVARALDPVRRRADHLWLVTDGECSAVRSQAYDYHCTYLETYMREHYRAVRRVALRGTLLRLYARLPQAGS